MLFSTLIAGLAAVLCVTATPTPADDAKKPKAPKCGKSYQYQGCTYKIYCNQELTGGTVFTDARTSLLGCIESCNSYEGQCIGATYDSAFSPGVCELTEGTVGRTAASNSTAIVVTHCTD